MPFGSGNQSPGSVILRPQPKDLLALGRLRQRPVLVPRLTVSDVERSFGCGLRMTEPGDWLPVHTSSWFQQWFTLRCLPSRAFCLGFWSLPDDGAVLQPDLVLAKDRAVAHILDHRAYPLHLGLVHRQVILRLD